MVGATFKGMCHMDGMCFAMLMRGKGFAHVLLVSSKALD